MLAACNLKQVMLSQENSKPMDMHGWPWELNDGKRRNNCVWIIGHQGFRAKVPRPQNCNNSQFPLVAVCSITEPRRAPVGSPGMCPTSEAALRGDITKVIEGTWSPRLPRYHGTMSQAVPFLSIPFDSRCFWINTQKLDYNPDLRGLPYSPIFPGSLWSRTRLGFIEDLR